MDEITLPRGDQMVTYQKAPAHFAVRLRAHRAQAVTAEVERHLAAGVGAVRHAASLAPEPLDLFAVEQADTLDAVMDALRAVPDVEMVTHVYTIAEAAAAMPETERTLLDRALIPTGALTVQFRAGTSAAACRAVLDASGLAAAQVLDFLPNGYTTRLAEAAGENTLKLAARLLEAPEVLRAEPDLCFRIDRKQQPGKPGARPWHLHNPGGRGLARGADVNAVEAWRTTRGTREVVVCLIDDGFDLDHPALSGPGKIVAPYNFVDNTSQPRPAGPDDNHGTPCAGLAVAEENSQGAAGLAPECAWMPLRTGDWLSDGLLVDLLAHAVYHGADVICCGWSAAAWNFPLSTKMHAAIHNAAARGRANRKGCLILFAAGNENRPLDGDKDGRRSYQGFALHPGVLAVAASNSQDRRSGYSNYGPALGLCAPSSGMQRLTTTDRQGSAGFSAGDYTSDFGGTSAAAALAAGAAALVFSANPGLSAQAARRILCETADKIDPGNGKYSGAANFGERSPWYGCGRINAGRAVARARGAESDLPLNQFLLENRPNRALPQRGALEDTLPCGLDYTIRAVQLELEIRHLYQGQPRLALVPPGGQPIPLYLPAQPAGPSHDLRCCYHSAQDPGLFDALIGASARGDWRLRVENRADFTSAVLARWALTFNY